MPRPPCRPTPLLLLLRRRLRPGARTTHSAAAAATTSASASAKGPAAPTTSPLLTLAIETSCDDTAVAVLSRCRATGRAALLFNERVSSDNRAFRGVNPVVAVQGHNASLAPLVRRALAALPRLDEDDGGASVTATSLTAAAAEGAAEGPARRTLDVDGTNRARPDFVSVTRGPGIMANLAVGLNVAKGLSVAWDVPLLAVHHMQAHALTPRLVASLGMDMAMGGGGGSGGSDSSIPEPGTTGTTTGTGKLVPDSAAGASSAPSFPFLSLLVSGGHTQLVHSASLTDHRIVATTGDIAIGNLLDQTARVILPEAVLDASPDVMYGRLLEAFAFPPSTDGSGSSSSSSISSNAAGSRDGAGDDGVAAQHKAFFRPAASRADEMVDVPSGYDWTVPLPFRNSRRLAYSFSSIHTQVHRIAASRAMDLAERRALARHTLRAAFQHLASRLVLALEDRPELLLPQQDSGGGGGGGSSSAAPTTTLVVAGGVASNRFLAHVLRTTLAARGFPDVRLVAPPVALCTDNAAMVAWTAMEMYQAGWRSDLSACPIGKWPMDPDAGPGIMGVDGWIKGGAEA